MGDVDIPDEIESMLSRRLPDSFIQEEHERFRRELAPLLADQARAAQVAILREMADRFEYLSEKWTAMNDHARASVYAVEAQHLHKKACELEACGGQTEAHDE